MASAGQKSRMRLILVSYDISVRREAPLPGLLSPFSLLGLGAPACRVFHTGDWVAGHALG
jgi:hypothetical protein